MVTTDLVLSHARQASLCRLVAVMPPSVSQLSLVFNISAVDMMHPLCFLSSARWCEIDGMLSGRRGLSVTVTANVDPTANLWADVDPVALDDTLRGVLPRSCGGCGYAPCSSLLIGCLDCGLPITVNRTSRPAASSSTVRVD